MGVKSFFLTLRDYHRLNLFQNTVVMCTSGPERNEVAGEWRRLHNKELLNLHPSLNFRVTKIRGVRYAGYSTNGKYNKSIQNFD
jgi:hypothetical protein